MNYSSAVTKGTPNRIRRNAGLLAPVLATVFGLMLSASPARADFTRIGSLTLPSGVKNARCAVIDPVAGFAYVGTLTTPPAIVQIRLSDFKAVSTLTLGGGTGQLNSAVIDVAGGFAYFGTQNSPAKVIKLRLSDFTAVGSLDLNVGENLLWTAAIDPAGGFAYFGTHTSPGRIVKVQLSNLTRVGALVLNAGENEVESAAIDPSGGFAYFGTNTSPGSVVKVKLSNFTRVGALTLNAGENMVGAALLDTAAGFAYFGTETNPGIVVKVRLSDFTRISALTLNFLDAFLVTGVIDPAGGFAYFGTNSSPGRIVRVWLPNLTRAGAVDLNGGENLIESAILDSSNNVAYFTTYTDPGNLVKIDVSPTPSISINDVSQSEGNAGTTAFNFTVSLSGPTSKTVSVNYATADNTAQAGSDYQAASGTLTFAAGETSKQITVNVNGDNQFESNEDFFVNLLSPTNATLADAQGVGTINNDDAQPVFGVLRFSPASYNVNENGGQATITVVRTVGSSGAVSVQYATTGGTAVGGADYTSTSGVLNWADGDSTSKTIAVAITNDLLDEADETISLTLSNPGGGATLGGTSNATVTISDDDPAPKVSIDDVSIAEGNSGTTSFVFTISLDAASGQTVSVNYTTADNTAVEASDYQAANGMVTFAPGETSKQITVLVNGDTQVESNETFAVNLYNLGNASVGKVSGLGSIVNDDSTSSTPTIQFSQAAYSVAEELGPLTITIIRSGDTSGAAAVDYTTADGSATQKADFEYAAGTLNFAAGETSKTLTLLVNEDMISEGDETFNVALSNPAGVTLGTQSTSIVTIVDDVPDLLNPIDDPQLFVHAHYHDFLNREPDAAGLAFWTSKITSCGSDAKCLESTRINVSASFFLSIEYQETAYLLYLMQKESYSTMPKYTSFMRDLQEVSRGVIVNAPGWQQKLADNQQQFADKWVNRAEFKAAYDALSNDAYVNALYKNAGIAPPQTQKDKLVAGLNTASMNRSTVLLEVANDATFRQQQQNGAFVLMEYFGYLRRDPNASPDSDLSGYNFWLDKLNQFNGNYIDAEMIKAFITSFEYRQRFGQ